MNDQQPISPRQRLQALLAIPERQRTDAEWDELNELEIALASVNRTEARDPGPHRSPPVSTGQPKPGSGAAGKRPARKFQRRPPKGSTP